MKRNLLKNTQKYLIGAAILPLAASCVDVTTAHGVIVGKADKSLYVDLDGDSIADQKLVISQRQDYWTDYAEIGDSITYDQGNKDAVLYVNGSTFSAVKTINSRDWYQVQHELSLRKMRGEIGQQKTR